MNTQQAIKLPMFILLFSILTMAASANFKPHTMLIPLYSYPNRWDTQTYTWKQLIEAKERHPHSQIIAIVNPDNGDFNQTNSDYEKGIQDLKAADIRIVGYVYTSYGDRNISEVKANIDAWQQYYLPLGVEGIFFDETSTDPQKLDHYRQLTDYAYSKGFGLAILNPGITTDQSYIDAGIADIVVTYENAYSDLVASPLADYNTPTLSTQLAILIHHLPSSDDVDQMQTFAVEHDFSYFYYTEDGADGNPWDSISQYTDKELKLIDTLSPLPPLYYLLD